MSANFNHYDYRLSPYYYTIPEGNWGIDMEARKQLMSIVNNKLSDFSNNKNISSKKDIDEKRFELIMKKAIKSLEEKERLEKICDQFLG